MKQSAGVLLFRGGASGALEVLIVHPGGPFWARKDAGVWSIPKGEYTDEEPREAAFREFAEEIGAAVPTGPVLELGSIAQSTRKVVTAFAVEGDLDVADLHSNTFEIEWPPHSGEGQEFPEVDRAEWVDLDRARRQLIDAQTVFLDRLVERLGMPQPENDA